MDIKEYLQKNFFLFSELNEAEFYVIMHNESINAEKFVCGDVLHNNKKSNKIGILLKGRAVIKSGDDGVIIRKLAANDIFGAAALFDAPSYTTSVIAVSDGEMLTLSKGLIERCIIAKPELALRYIEFLSKRISFLNSKINAYTAKSAENKLYAYLLQLPREENMIKLPVNMATLAKMIGFGRATLYRALDKLVTQGLIIKNDKFIILNEV